VAQVVRKISRTPKKLRLHRIPLWRRECRDFLEERYQAELETSSVAVVVAEGFVRLAHESRESVCEIHIAALSRANNFAASWCANTGRQGGPICLQG
jgi:hypothetical protein